MVMCMRSSSRDFVGGLVGAVAMVLAIVVAATPSKAGGIKWQNIGSDERVQILGRSFASWDHYSRHGAVAIA